MPFLRRALLLGLVALFACGWVRAQSDTWVELHSRRLAPLDWAGEVIQEAELRAHRSPLTLIGQGVNRVHVGRGETRDYLELENLLRETDSAPEVRISIEPDARRSWELPGQRPPAPKLKAALAVWELLDRKELDRLYKQFPQPVRAPASALNHIYSRLTGHWLSVEPSVQLRDLFEKQSDDELLTIWQQDRDFARSKAAFDELFSRFSGQLLRVQARRLRDEQKARDLVQDAYLELLWSSSLRPITNFASTLFATAKWRASDVQREELKWSRQETEPSDDESIASSEAMPTTPEELAIREEWTASLQQALRQIPQEDRQLLELAYFTDPSLTQREIGERIGKSQSGVSKLKQRAIERLQRLMTLQPQPGRVPGPRAQSGRETQVERAVRRALAGTPIPDTANSFWQPLDGVPAKQPGHQAQAAASAEAQPRAEESTDLIPVLMVLAVYAGLAVRWMIRTWNSRPASSFQVLSSGQSQAEATTRARPVVTQVRRQVR